MKNILLFSALMLSTSFTAYADGASGGGTGGMGIVVDSGEKVLALEYVGQYGLLDLVKAKPNTFNQLDKLKNSRVKLMGFDRIISGEISDPEFVGAISIKTDDGQSVVIVNENDFAEEVSEEK